MMFLIRAAFWLMILILLLPSDDKQRSDVYGTAEAAVKDVSGFCERNPNVCSKGRDAFDVFMQKAEFGAQMLMGFVSEKAGNLLASDPAAPASEATEGEIIENAEDKQGLLGRPQITPTQSLPAAAPPAGKPVSAGLSGSQDTLTIEDLIPAWSGRGRSGA